MTFCTTDFEDPESTEAGLPPCEDGGTYYGTLEVSASVPFSFTFLYNADADNVRCDYIGLTEVFYSDTRTFTETLLSASPTVKTDFPAAASSEITVVLATVVPPAVSWFAGSPGDGGGCVERRRGRTYYIGPPPSSL